jgi:wobble nucleotide-excising tRNase
MEIFDDRFVDENVCSGLEVAPGHRQKLHELILGAQGVALHNRVTAAVREIEEVIVRVRSASNAIPAAEREGLSADDFCNLSERLDASEAIVEEERALAATREAQAIRTTAMFEQFHLTQFDTERIAAILLRDLPALERRALASVQEHLETLGVRGEQWVATGMAFLSQSQHDNCPFCAQALDGSPMIGPYRDYFSEEYARLKADVAGLLSDLDWQHNGDARGALERSARITQERRQFWQKFISVPELTLDTAAVVNAWKAAYDAAKSLIERKQAAPLEAIDIPDEVTNLLRNHAASAQSLSNLEPAIKDGEHANRADPRENRKCEYPRDRDEPQAATRDTKSL